MVAQLFIMHHLELLISMLLDVFIYAVTICTEVGKETL